jgi:hypothetical protein
MFWSVVSPELTYSKLLLLLVEEMSKQLNNSEIFFSVCLDSVCLIYKLNLDI